MTDSYMLITGGTGFLGAKVCARALEKNYRVAVLTRDRQQAEARLPSAVACYESLSDIADLAEVSCLVNLAGEPLADGRWNKQRKAEFYQSRVTLTERLFEHFSGRNIVPPVVISGSAIGYYGPHNDRVLDESAVFHDSFSHQLCAAWENAAQQFSSRGSRVCRIRTGIVLDKDKGALAKMLTPFRLGLGGVIGNGRQWMPWIHIDDYVNLIFHAIRRSDMRGAINATAPNAVTNRQFTRALGKVLRRPTFFAMPAPIARLMFGEMAKELLLSGQRVYPRKALETGFKFSYPELEPALRDLLGKC